MTEARQKVLNPQELMDQGLDRETADWIADCLNNQGLRGQIMVKMWFAVATGETTIEQLGRDCSVIKE